MKRKALSENEAMAINQSTMAPLARVKMYHRYDTFMQMKVVWLRARLRRRGYRKWYCLKKGALVSTCVADEAARIIARLIDDIARRKSEQIIAQRVAEGAVNKCPICLTAVQDFETRDLFVHDGVVFCKEDIVAYLSSNYNFSNPITRKCLGPQAVRRLGSASLRRKFAYRWSLRKQAVDLSSQFFFLENEVVPAFRELLAVVDCSGTDVFQQQMFREAYMIFDTQVQQMVSIDPKRSVCVLKGLRGVISEWPGTKAVTTVWSNDLIGRYITATSAR